MSDARFFVEGLARSLDSGAAVQQAGQESLHRADRNSGAPVAMPLDKAFGFDMRTLDLSTLATAVPIGLGGYEVAYVAQGSTPSGVLIFNEQVVLFPGQRLRGYFEDLRVRRGNAADGALLNSATVGSALLVVQKLDNLEYRENNLPAGGMALLAQQAVTALTFGGASDYWAPTAAGGMVASASQGVTWDLRRYRQALLIWEGTFENAVTVEVDFPGYASALSTNTFGAPYTTTAASGGVASILVGSPLAQLDAGSQYLSKIHVFSPARLPFARIKTFTSGDPGVITGGLLTLFGIN